MAQQSPCCNTWATSEQSAPPSTVAKTEAELNTYQKHITTPSRKRKYKELQHFKPFTRPGSPQYHLQLPAADQRL